MSNPEAKPVRFFRELIFGYSFNHNRISNLIEPSVGGITMIEEMKRLFVLTLSAAGSLFFFSSCAPKEKALPKQEASAAKATSSHSFLSGSRSLEGLTLEDYAALNGNMTSLLERSGFVYCRGYLTPTSGLHGTTYPTLSVESYSGRSIEKSTNEMIAMIDKFFAECEKDLSRWRNSQTKSNQSPQPMPGQAPGSGSS